MVNKGLLLLLLGSASALTVTVSPTTGQVTCRSGEVVLETVDVVVGHKAASRGELALTKVLFFQGTDALGDFHATKLVYPQLEATVQVYDDKVVFEQRFPKAISKPGNESLASTVWPAFGRTTAQKCFSYHGIFPTMAACDTSSYEASHQGGSPLVVYDDNDTFIFSSLDHHKAQHMASTDEWFGAGVKAGVSEIPANWTQRFILVAGSHGIRRTFENWGSSLRAWHNVERTMRENAYRDAVHGTIGFWTDNGGFYHYSTGPDTSLTYEDVLTDVKKYHDSLGVPFGHWQFDSWFYPKDSDVEKGGGGGAVTNWTALDSVFPSGIPSMVQNNLNGMPMIMHNRQWSPVSDYIANNEPKGMEWLSSNGAAVPKDPFVFFEWFFQQQDGWGLMMYEQDWLSKEYDLITFMTQNITLADDWLYGMVHGVAVSGRTEQFCMPYAYDILVAGALTETVTNARATNDYFHASNHRNWAIGATSLFYSALEILPFKDGFYSSNLLQPGGQEDGPETDPDRETLMAVLSTAQVGPMDGLGYLNASRILRTCRSDGMILKPDRPIVLADACFHRGGDPYYCDVFVTLTTISSHLTHFLYVDDPTSLVHSESIADLLAPEQAPGDSILFNFYTRAFRSVTPDTILTDIDPGYEGHTYLLIAPVLFSHWAFVGEVDKYVPVSSFRFQTIALEDDESLHITLVAAPNETVGPICAVYDATSLICDSITNSLSQNATLSLTLSSKVLI